MLLITLLKLLHIDEFLSQFKLINYVLDPE